MDANVGTDIDLVANGPAGAEAQSDALNVAGNPPTPPAPPTQQPRQRPLGVPKGAKLFDEQQPTDRTALAEAIRRHANDVEELDEEEQQLAESGAQLVASGVPEPFTRKPWYFRPRRGAPVALLNYVCGRYLGQDQFGNDILCDYATLDERHIWMHASDHLKRGE